ncbi:ribosome maturation protein [Tirmania nivea]|nr:ribosome maturation protein [Tirmania nivea]
MTRGDKPTTRVHYKGDHNDFVIFAESPEIVCRWKKDRSIPLMEVVDGFHIFTTRHQGAQGHLEEASHLALDSEFGTHNVDDVVRHILERGEVKEGKERERTGNTNVTLGSMGGHT